MVGLCVACIIVVDEGSVYDAKCISSFAVLLFFVFEIGSNLKILFQKSQNAAFISIIFQKKKHLRYMAQICYELLFWHHICKIRREVARRSAMLPITVHNAQLSMPKHDQYSK